MALNQGEQLAGTALTILIVGLVFYGVILFIQWLTRNNRTRIIERDVVVQDTLVPVQTQFFTPRATTAPSMSGNGAMAGARVGGGVSKGGAL